MIVSQRRLGLFDRLLQVILGTLEPRLVGVVLLALPRWQLVVQVVLVGLKVDRMGIGRSTGSCRRSSARGPRGTRRISPGLGIHRTKRRGGVSKLTLVTPKTIVEHRDNFL